MGVAATTTEAAMSAIQESLVQLRVSLTRIAARQEQMLVTLKNTTAALTPTATAMLLSVPGRVPEKQATKPSSPSIVSVNRAVAIATPCADELLAYATPTGCSTVGLSVNVGINNAVVVFPTSGTSHLPTASSTSAGNSTPQGVVGSGVNMSADCSTHVLTCRPSNPGAQALEIDTEMPSEVMTLVGGLSLFTQLDWDSTKEIFNDNGSVWDGVPDEVLTHVDNGEKGITHPLPMHETTVCEPPSLVRSLRASCVPRPMAWPYFLCDGGSSRPTSSWPATQGIFSEFGNAAVKNWDPGDMLQSVSAIPVSTASTKRHDTSFSTVCLPAYVVFGLVNQPWSSWRSGETLGFQSNASMQTLDDAPREICVTLWLLLLSWPRCHGTGVQLNQPTAKLRYLDNVQLVEVTLWINNSDVVKLSYSIGVSLTRMIWSLAWLFNYHGEFIHTGCLMTKASKLHTGCRMQSGSAPLVFSRCYLPWEQLGFCKLWFVFKAIYTAIHQCHPSLPLSTANTYASCWEGSQIAIHQGLQRLDRSTVPQLHGMYWITIMPVVTCVFSPGNSEIGGAHGVFDPAPPWGTNAFQSRFFATQGDPLVLKQIPAWDRSDFSPHSVFEKLPSWSCDGFYPWKRNALRYENRHLNIMDVLDADMLLLRYGAWSYLHCSAGQRIKYFNILQQLAYCWAWPSFSLEENAENNILLMGTNLHDYVYEFYSNQQSNLQVQLLWDPGDVHDPSIIYVALGRPWDPGIVTIREWAVKGDISAEVGAAGCEILHRAIAWGQAMFLGGGNVMTAHVNPLGLVALGQPLPGADGCIAIYRSDELHRRGIEQKTEPSLRLSSASPSSVLLLLSSESSSS